MPDFDLFLFFRTMLFVFLTAYSVLLLTTSIWRLKVLFSGSDPTRQMLRLYLSFHLLTIGLKPLRGELAQILFWLSVLACLWWLHTLV